MDKLNLDSMSRTITCPVCSQEHTHSIGWFKAHPQITCGCGVVNNVDVTKFDQAVAKAQHSADKLRATLRKLGKR